MTTYAEVEAFALTLPETTSTPSYGGAPALRVNKRMFARLRGEMADQIDQLTGEAYGDVLMVGVQDLGAKDALLASDSRAYFTVPHYDGYPAVLVRLAEADLEELRELLMEAWMRSAPKRALNAYADTIGPLPGTG
ncbi:MAG: MmcQ/YjbR family DNA-binding protein [Nocardioidaceae bacterium]